MTVRTIRVALLLALLPAAGCGTLSNLAQPSSEEGGRVPFGGVKRDIARLHKAGAEPGRKPESEQYPAQVLTLLCALDLPFSLIGDVLTWPYTAPYAIVNAPVPATPVVLAEAPTAQPPAVVLPTVPPATKTMPIPTPPGPIPPDALPKAEKRY